MEQVCYSNSANRTVVVVKAEVEDITLRSSDAASVAVRICWVCALMQILKRESVCIVRSSTLEPTPVKVVAMGHINKQIKSVHIVGPTEQANAVRTMAIGRPSGWGGVNWVTANHTISWSQTTAHYWSLKVCKLSHLLMKLLCHSASRWWTIELFIKLFIVRIFIIHLARIRRLLTPRCFVARATSQEIVNLWAPHWCWLSFWTRRQLGHSKSHYCDPRRQPIIESRWIGSATYW